jgi:hypothetical protein
MLAPSPVTLLQASKECRQTAVDAYRLGGAGDRLKVRD